MVTITNLKNKLPKSIVNLWILSIIVFPLSEVKAENNFDQAINFCPAGFLYGVTTLNYEKLINNRHGVLIRVDYESVPEAYTDANMESTGQSLTLGYRWHFSPQLASWYLGPYYRYRTYEGNGQSDGKNFNFKLTEQTLGVAAGKRWIWNNGVNVNLAFGYGASELVKTSSNSSQGIKGYLDSYSKESNSLGGFLGEFSVGYAF